MGCRVSPPTPSGKFCTRRTTPTNARVPGALPARRCANARLARWPSPTPMPRPKKVDRGRLHAGGVAGSVGLVLRPGRPVPDRPLPRPRVAAGGTSGPTASRVPAQRHGQGADPVPPGRWPRPAQGRDGLPQRGPARLAQARVDRHPGHAPPGPSAGRYGDVAWTVGALAARVDGEADPRPAVAAFADVVGAG